MNRYYCTIHTPTLGTVPKGFTAIKEFDEQTYTEAIHRSAWGWVEYDRELTDEEMYNYDLVLPSRMTEYTIKGKTVFKVGDQVLGFFDVQTQTYHNNININADEYMDELVELCRRFAAYKVNDYRGR